MSKPISRCIGPALLAFLALAGASHTDLDAQGCGVGINPIVCENGLPGNPSSEWDVSGSGDSTIQGFATEFSVVPGQIQRFKIDTNSNNYGIDIYRMGYYNGAGARKVASISPSASLPQNQPNCLTQPSTGLMDCGNWAVSASWTVPANAVSGIYFALLTRFDTGGQSHIVFVVRDDSRGADILFQTSDTTWQAYNEWGGNSLYVGNPVGRAYKVSYNRPFGTRGTSPQDFVFNAEYPMVRWLERNGYDVSYASGIDTDRSPAELLEHRMFLSIGHDEYWSGTQRANVEAARAAGVHLAFLSGNAVFWKTRWETSIDGQGTPYRTLVTYKETHANAVIDPAAPTWTGTWRDPRFSPPGDGGRQENALMGTSFVVNAGTTGITVPAAEGKHRFWRNTTIATLPTGGSATLPNGTLGYEWDEAPNNAFTPDQLMRLSLTTASVPSKLVDYGSTYAAGSATHSLTLYRHPSGALVFGGGTIQWSWGLDSNHDRGNAAADARMKQATVNLLADMNILPQTLESGFTADPAPDATAPTSVITSPASGATIAAGTNVTISGTASDVGGIVGGVQVSTDGGATWNAATGKTSWTYTWVASGNGAHTIQSRAYDDSGNVETPSGGVGVTVTGPTCPCTIWAPTAVPSPADDGDPGAVELGTRFRSDNSGYITGIRFYKASANTGTHTGRLWTNSGTLLGTVTFSGETASGWQQATLPNAVPINANTTYVVSYHAPNGHYTGTDNTFATSIDRAPLHGLASGVDGPNGVYRYGSGGVFPTETWQAEAYWVDVVFTTIPPPDFTAPTVTGFFPANGATGVDPAAAVTATFSEAIDPATLTTGSVGEGGTTPGSFELRDPANALVRGTLTFDSTTRVATLRPDASLALSTTFTVTVRGGTTDPRVKDLAGNALAANTTWTFTTAASPPPPPSCPCTIWTPSTIPQKIDDGDINSTELGTRFRSDVAGFVTGARFYKAAANTGTHIAKLWNNGGSLLGSVTFTGETATGWQEATFPAPIAIAANTTYIISYHANNGHYSSASQYFATTGVDRYPLHALRDGVDGANGVYQYGASAFPTQTFQSEGYFVDVVFNTTNGPDTTPPFVSAVAPVAGMSGVRTNTTVTVVFNENMNAATITNTSILLRDSANNFVTSAVTYAAGTKTATLTPSSALAYSTTYTAIVKGGATDPRVKDAAGNALASDYTWSFTTAAPPPPPPTQGPGGPVLIVTAASNPFSSYLAEIVRTEGLNAFATADMATVSAATLAGYDVVILGEMPLTAAQVSMFTTWVTSNGGNLIAMRPDKQLAGLMGLTDAGTTLAEGYLLVNTAAAPGTGIVGQTMQFHGTADRYTLNGATTVATLYSNATTSTPNPAVTMRSVGSNGGQAVAFTYDLGRSVVYTRQGNPAWAGTERDGQVPIRSDDLFFGPKTGDVQPNYIDFNKIQIPQADEQQRLLWNAMLQIAADRKPLPRFWYFPRMLKAVVIMTGDDHANGGTAGRFDQYMSLSPPNCSLTDWTCIRGSSYIFPGTPLNAAAVTNYVQQGFEIALHVNTNCLDYTPTSIANFYTTQLGQFATQYPQAGAPTTHRTHCIAWSDYTSQAQVEFNNGIRLDTTYYYWPGTWVLDRPGHFTGSGMPMRFATLTGAMIDVYQAATQITDESSMNYQLHANTLLDNALGSAGYYAAVTANMHTDFNPSQGQIGSDAIIASAQARSVPVISAKQMLEWLDGRNGSSFSSITWGSNLLRFNIAVGAGANGLYTMVPASAGAAPIAGLTVNAAPVTYTVQTIKGVSYAVFPAQAGTYEVSYGVDVIPPVISSVSATPFTSTATVQWATNEVSDSLVAYGTNPSSLTLTASNTALVAVHSVPLSSLAPNTTYYYRVTSADAAANSTTSPTTGNPPLSFTTAPPSIAVADATVVEGNSGTVTAAFAVTLSVASTQTVTVNFATSNGSATAGSDYTAGSGTVTFNPGETSKSIGVLVTGDTLSEGNETFTVTLTNPTNAVLGDGVAAGTITNDDPVPSISINDVSVTEGNSGVVNAVFNVTLSGASGSTITVNFATAAGTATAGTDYVTTSGSLSFAAGVTAQTITVPVVGDSANELDEQFVVNLSTPVNATIADAQGSGTIVNDDPVPSITIGDVSLSEGNSGTKLATFALILSAASGRTVTVGYATANGSASAGTDYVAASGTATFAAGITTVTVNVTINGDTLSEPDETFVVNLSAPSNATIADAQATGTITNDEGLPALSINDVTVTEGNSGTVNAVLTVTLAPSSAQTVTVAYATANTTATAGSDYTAASGTLTFGAGVTAQTITVPVTGDTVVETNETFAVNLSAPVNASVLDSQGVVTITNDDAAPGVGLVLALGFGEGSGTTTSDSSAAGNNGSISGATWSTAGKNGNALSFDGVNDMVTVADSAALDVTRITMMAWVRPTALSGWRTAMLKEAGSNGLAYSLYAHDNAPRPAAYINTGGPDRSADGTTSLALNTWTHLATTYDGATLRLYVNGVEVGSRAVTGNISASTDALRIGGNAIWGEWFAGLIDDVRVYNRALTVTEIQTDMNAPVTQ